MGSLGELARKLGTSLMQGRGAGEQRVRRDRENGFPFLLFFSFSSFSLERVN
jgi:hypothetical protein